MGYDSHFINNKQIWLNQTLSATGYFFRCLEAAKLQRLPQTLLLSEMEAAGQKQLTGKDPVSTKKFKMNLLAKDQLCNPCASHLIRILLELFNKEEKKTNMR